MEDNKVISFIIKNKFILIIIVIIMTIICYILFKSFKQSPILPVINTFEVDLEKEITNIAETYYQDEVKGKVIGIEEYRITLAILESSGYDVNIFRENNCDFDKSYSNIIIDDPNEINTQNINYSIKVHLSCD